METSQRFAKPLHRHQCLVRIKRRQLKNLKCSIYKKKWYEPVQQRRFYSYMLNQTHCTLQHTLRKYWNFPKYLEIFRSFVHCCPMSPLTTCISRCVHYYCVILPIRVSHVHQYLHSRKIRPRLSHSYLATPRNKTLNFD